MCGIVGFGPLSSSSSVEIHKMANSLRHRGPDAVGTWIDPDGTVAFGHTRLSILDLSDNGNQPLNFGDGRYCLVFNGEIYNHLALRTELEKLYGHYFLGSGDTETLAASILCVGLENTLQKIDGMFAFALWDKKRGRLYLARDHFGQKPIYYGWLDGTFYFASELKAIEAIFSGQLEVESEALYGFLRYNYINGPLSIYKHIFKVEPGKVVEIELSRNRTPSPIIHNFWDPSLLSDCSKNELTEDVDYVNLVERTIYSSVKKLTISDVQIGTFLSGGVDSSLITLALQENVDYQVKSFTLGFEQADFDERAVAKEVAQFIGTDHHEIILDEINILESVKRMGSVFCEPFADASQIPSYLLSKFAAEKVKVVMGGDGGDELFAGYNRHIYCKKIIEMNSLQKSIGALMRNQQIQRAMVSAFDIGNNFLKPFGSELFESNLLREKLSKLVNAVGSRAANELYSKIIENTDAASVIMSAPKSSIDLELASNTGCVVKDIMLLDINNYLPGDILVKTDRTTMSNGLECRSPFLDLTVAQLAFNIPVQYNIKNGQGKQLLREILKRKFPSHIFNRTKQGFSVPISSLLRGKLHEWAQDSIYSSSLEQDAHLDHRSIQDMWARFERGEAQNTQLLWAILMYIEWRTDRVKSPI